MNPYDFRPCKPNGHELTDRETVISQVDKAIYELCSIFGNGEERQLNDAVFRLTDGHKRRMTAAMLKDLGIALRLTRKLAVEIDRAAKV